LNIWAVLDESRSAKSPRSGSIRAASIAARTSSLRATPTAATLAPIYSGRDAPMRAVATVGWASTHASASWAVLMPSSSAIAPSRVYLRPFAISASGHQVSIARRTLAMVVPLR
jgi:hypothetical protein